MPSSTRPQGRVAVNARLESEHIICTVQDNGPGIPPHMLPKVFDKHATDPAKGGTGLGLAIVKQIVEAHGGTVSAESSAGSGATICFSIPDGPATQI
jgi:signal transduction histidine kinase